MGAAQEDAEAGLFDPVRENPVPFEAWPVIDVEIEPAAGVEGARDGAGDTGEIGLSRDVIDRVVLADDEIDAAGEAESSHIGLQNGDGEPGAADIGTGEPAHGGREVDGGGVEAEAREFDGGRSRAAGQVAHGVERGVQGGEDLAASGEDGFA